MFAWTSQPGEAWVQPLLAATALGLDYRSAEMWIFAGLIIAMTLFVVWNRQLRRSLEVRNISITQQLEQLREAEEKLVHRVAFENVVAHTSRAFLMRPTTDLEVLFDESLRQVGRFLRVDRGYIFLISEDRQTVSNLYEWCAPKTRPFKDSNQDLPIEEIPTLLDPIIRGEPVILNDVDDVPEFDVYSKLILETQSIQSMICVPMVIERGVIGFIGFDSVKSKRTWSDEDVKLLTLLGEMFGGAIQRRESETQLSQARRRLETILDASPFPLGLTRLSDDRLLFANDRLIELLELERLNYGDVSADTLYVNPADRARLLEQVNIWGRCDDFETRMLTVQGHEFWARLSALVIDYDGERCLLATINDITETRRANQQIVKAREAAEAANRSKSEFLSNMSHEIRTPMTSVLGFAELLLEPEVSRDDRLAYAGLIERHGRHLLAIINDILDLSKIEAGRLDIERERCDLGQVLTDLRTTLAHRAIDRGLELSFEFEGTVPRYIQTDAVRLRQILMNLVGNALKFTEQGNVTVQTMLCPDPDGEDNQHLCFKVIDTGIGIHEKSLNHLFEPFRQADSSTSRRFGGTGLGLTISQRLSQMLGGSIRCESQVGQGSVFTLNIEPGEIDLSQTMDNLTDLEVKKPPSKSFAESNTLEGRVLLAEDGPDNQRLIMYLLKRLGLDATLAVNGLDVLDKVEETAESQQPYDIILMDIQMPELDGLSATRRLRESGYEGVIIALTAHALDEERQRSLDAGCQAHLSKPIVRNIFVETLAKYLRDPMVEAHAQGA